LGWSVDAERVVVVGFCTVRVTGADVLPACAASPAYVAVTTSVPSVGKEVVRVAWPAASRVPVPRTTVPCSKVTVPLEPAPPPRLPWR
jgi:hypothetical protein